MSDIKRYTKDNAPRVQLNLDNDPTSVGWLIEEGPVQSIVRWPNGNETCVVNTWIKRVEGPMLLRALPDAAAVRMQAPKNARGQTLNDELNMHAQMEQAGRKMIKEQDAERKPKGRKAPDEIALRVAEFDDARLQQFATANGCWQDKYLELPNNGLRRMNVLNRLRAKIKNDPAYVVVWP